MVSQKTSLHSFESILNCAEDATKSISSILESSKNAKVNFQCQWQSILDTYDSDMSIINNELSMIPPTLSQYMEMKEKQRNGERFKQRKQKRTKKEISTSHPLNPDIKRDPHHMNNDRNHNSEIIERSKDQQSQPNVYSPSFRKFLLKEQREMNEEERKFLLREQIFTELEKKEDELSKSKGDLKSEYKLNLEQLEQKSYKILLNLIAQYKPDTKYGGNTHFVTTHDRKFSNHYEKRSEYGRSNQMISQNLPVKIYSADSTSLNSTNRISSDNIDDSFDLESEDDYASDDFET